MSNSAASSSRASHVYDHVKWEITHGLLTPGAPLTEEDLAARLEVSRTPVREAMQRLAADGLIDSHRRRWKVHRFTREEVDDVYEVRCALEGLAARLAAERATAQERDTLRNFRPHADHAATLRTERVDLNDYLHTLIGQYSHNERLERLIQANRALQLGVRMAPLYTVSELRASADEHLALIEAICTQDPDLAFDIAVKHMSRARGIVLDRLFPGEDS